MTRIVTLGLMLLVCIVCVSVQAQVQGTETQLGAYDNFNRQFLDPTKWATSSPCFTWTVLDCVREIQNGRLRLAVRGYGATDSNQGGQYGESELHFIRPTTIKSIVVQ